MCKVLQIPRSTYYYDLNKQTVDDSEDVISHKVVEIFNANRQCFGTRRIKHELNKIGLKVSRRRIGRIMKAEKLVSMNGISKIDSVEISLDRHRWRYSSVI